MSLCISLLVGKSPSRSEHLYGKTATNITFFQGMMMILHKKNAFIGDLRTKVFFCHKMLKKVTKIAVLRFMYSDL